jgi:hypothetical protein
MGTERRYLNGVDLGLFGAKRDETKRDKLKRQFAAETYLTASFFGMNRVTEGDKNTPLNRLDAEINVRSGAQLPMAHPAVKERFIPTREPMPSYPKGK